MEKWRKTWSMYKSISSHIFWKKSFFFLIFPLNAWTEFMFYVICVYKNLFSRISKFFIVFSTNQNTYFFRKNTVLLITHAFNWPLLILKIGVKSASQAETTTNGLEYKVFWNENLIYLGWKSIHSDISVSTWTQNFLLKWIYDI